MAHTSLASVVRPRPSITAATGRWVVALVLLAALICAFFDRISIAVLFTNADFTTAMGTGFDPARLGLLMTAFLIPYALSALLLSFTGDRFGPRRALCVATMIWGGLMLLMGAVSSYAVMIVYRVLLGIAEGPQFSWTMKTIKRWFPQAEHARANSVWLIGSPLGSAIGFPLTIWLVASFGWRASFYALGALNLVVVLPLLLAVLRDRPPESSATMVDDTTPARSFWQDCGVFLRSREFWLMVAFNCGTLTFLWGLNSWLPTYLKTVRHFDVQQQGIFSSLPFVLTFLGMLSSGIISDWVGRRAILCFLGQFAAGTLVYLGSILPDAHMAAFAIALGAGCWGLVIPAFLSVVLQVVPQSVTASGAGVINGIANLIGALAPFAMGWIMRATGDFNAGLLFLVLVTVVCSCLILPLVRRY
jgi:sugar phosphate permease